MERKCSYCNLFDKMPPFFNIITFEYPGKGTRMKEQLIADTLNLINDRYQQVRAL